jgi:hypothetical protein
MALKEYYEVDTQTGEWIEVHLLDDEADEIPSNYVSGWGPNRAFYKPKYDFTINDWVEGKDYQEILEIVKREKLGEMNRKCEEAILGYFKANVDGVEYEFSFDREAQTNFTGTMILFSQGIIDSIEWTAWKDDVAHRITLSKEQFMQIAGLAFEHKNSKITRLRNELQPQIESCTTVEEVQAITW